MRFTVVFRKLYMLYSRKDICDLFSEKKGYNFKFVENSIYI